MKPTNNINPKPLPTVKPDDIATAAIPPVAAISLGQIHTVIGIIGGLLGIAYLLWKWRKEANG